jgi:transposase
MNEIPEHNSAEWWEDIKRRFNEGKLIIMRTPPSKCFKCGHPNYKFEWIKRENPDELVRYWKCQECEEEHFG